jgi:hypothetical protein
MRKGQVVSEEVKEKVKRAKALKLVSKYNWDIVEPYLDVVVDNGTGKRGKKFITLREFRSGILSGKSIKDLIEEGISKHLIQFFSNLCQGKINLLKEDFEELYLQGSSLEEICKEKGITRDDITFLRQLYEVKRKGAKYINRKKTEISLTQRQKDIIYGSLMGDAKKMSKEGTSVSFVQGGKQKGYLYWKYSELENLASDRGVKEYSTYDKRFNNTYLTWRFYTKVNSDIEKIIHPFYCFGRKEITEDILYNLEPLSIAVWYMDDGSTDYNRKKGEVTNLIFCTDSFSEDSCYNIVDWFEEVYKISSYIRFRGRAKDGFPKYRVVVKKESVSKLIDLIEPHILPMFRYKIDYDAYVEWKT